MSLNITSADTPIKVDRANILIYAPPGTGKTSLAFSSFKPLLLDFDRGAHRSAFRRDIVPVEHWSEVANLDPKDLADYDTIIVDTVGRGLDKLTNMLQQESPKLRTKHGGLTLQGYGELKAAFTAWIQRLQSMGKDIVLVAHDKEEKRGEATVLRADIQGGSYSEIFKLADSVGYLRMDGNKRSLDFSPSEFHSGKNPAALPIIEVPDLNQQPDFLGGIIVQIKDAIGQIAEEAKAAAKEVNKFRRQVTKVETDEQMNELLEKVNAIEQTAIQVQVKRLMMTRIEEIGVRFDGRKKAFVAIDQDKPEQKNAA